MKKILLVLICLILLSGCNKDSVDVNGLLMDAMNSKITFIDEENKSVYFKDVVIYENDKAVPGEFAFIDLDKDGVEELSVLTTSYYGAYLILHYDKSSKNVYGFLLGARSFEDLREDGSFIGSGGASVSSYNIMTFDKQSMSIEETAYCDYNSNEFIINDKVVSKDEFEKYVEERNKINTVDFVKYN